MRTRTDYIIPSFVVAWGCIACSTSAAEPEAVQEVEQAYVEVANGLKTINGLTGINGLIGINGLTVDNGLTLINNKYALNGLATARGEVVPCCADQQNMLACDAMARMTTQKHPAAFCAPDGLLSAKTGMMSTTDGVVTASYVVRCALPASDSITVRDFTGRLVRLNGELGLAPQWKTGFCDTTCQEWVTACLMALTNASGEHVTIELSSPAPSIGSGHSAAFPQQEGAFYGNVFESPPHAYVCVSLDEFMFMMLDSPGLPRRSCKAYEDLLGTGSCPYKLSGLCIPGPPEAPWFTHFLDQRIGICRYDTADFGSATECSSLTVNDYAWHNVVTTYLPRPSLHWMDAIMARFPSTP